MNVTDSQANPIGENLARAMDQIHADYEAVMKQRTDKAGNFDPMLLPKGRECIPALSQ